MRELLAQLLADLLTPEELDAEITALLADGRWRLVSEIATELHVYESDVGRSPLAKPWRTVAMFEALGEPWSAT